MLKKQTIVIVDDVQENIQVLSSMLFSEGYNLAIAKNGKQAISVVEKKLPDLILMDVSMPEMDGFTACRILKGNQTTKHIPIVFLTARTETSDLVKGFELGAVDYITKPFNKAELLTRVSTHLELKSSRDALKESENELRKSNTAKDKFFSILAHDLRSPYSAILGLADMIVQSCELKNYNAVEEYGRIIFDSAQQSFNLLNNLLQWSRVQTGTIPFKQEVIKIADIAEMIRHLYAGSLSKKHIHFIFQNELSEDIIGDSFMLETIFRNLISNAIKYTSSGGRIYFTAKENTTENIISVRDTGIGISEENRGKLFKVESSFSTIGTCNEEGTGLGLILCKEFVEKHDGSISVDSSPGDGSEFIIRLPKVPKKDYDTRIIN